MAQNTYGDFIDLVEKTEITEAAVFIEQWKKLATDEQWKKYRTISLGPELITGFAWDVVTHFRRRIAGIDTEELYSLVIKDGHDFLREVCEKATKLGVQVNLDQIDAPLTPSEAKAQHRYFYLESGVRN